MGIYLANNHTPAPTTCNKLPPLTTRNQHLTTFTTIVAIWWGEETIDRIIFIQNLPHDIAPERDEQTHHNSIAFGTMHRWRLA